jgi:hypothetical protein
MFRKTAVALATVWGTVFFCAAPAGAQSQPDAPQASPASAAQAPKKQDLGSWWQKNPLEYNPVPKQWLFHAEGTLSYMSASGNTDGSTFDVSGDGEVRKNRLSSRSFAQLSRRNITYGAGQSPVDYVERTLREQVDYSLAWYLKIVGGVEGYRNTMMYMDKRLNVYGGAGATMLRNQKQQITLTAALGRTKFVFDRARMMEVNPVQASVLDTSPASGGAMAMQTWRWNVSPHFSFNQDASYMKYFNSDLGYRWTVNVSGNVPINKHLSFNVSYRYKKETNTIIDALYVKPSDRTFLMGIRASI